MDHRPFHHLSFSFIKELLVGGPLYQGFTVTEASLPDMTLVAARAIHSPDGRAVCLESSLKKDPEAQPL